MKTIIIFIILSILFYNNMYSNSDNSINDTNNRNIFKCDDIEHISICFFLNHQMTKHSCQISVYSDSIYIYKIKNIIENDPSEDIRFNMFSPDIIPIEKYNAIIKYLDTTDYIIKSKKIDSDYLLDISIFIDKKYIVHSIDLNKNFNEIMGILKKYLSQSSIDFIYRYLVKKNKK